MVSIFQYIESIAASGMPVLILGETGSGKEMIAKAVHDISGLRGSYVAKEREAFQSTLQAEPMTPDPAVLQHLRTRYYVEGASAPAGGAEPPASTDGEAAGAP